jgi:hypothetical protein
MGGHTVQRLPGEACAQSTGVRGKCACGDGTSGAGACGPGASDKYAGQGHPTEPHAWSTDVRRCTHVVQRRLGQAQAPSRGVWGRCTCGLEKSRERRSSERCARSRGVQKKLNTCMAFCAPAPPMNRTPSVLVLGAIRRRQKYEPP